MRAESHHPYVKVVIIVSVLGLLTRTVGARFAEGDTESKVRILVAGLQQMRSHLDLYRAQHEGRLPPTDSFGTFEITMTSKVGEYGPYVRRVPVNPFNSLNTVRFDGEAAGCGKAGWRLDSGTGLFQADNDARYAAL